MRFLSVFFGLAFLTQSALADGVYETYHNSRFGYFISYPEDVLYPQGEADDGDGQKFLSKDADAELLAYGSNNTLNQSLEDLFRHESRGGTGHDSKKVVTYRVLGDHWFVFSGFNSGKVFYQKTILKNNQFESFYFEYPESKKSIFEPILRDISNSFKG